MKKQVLRTTALFLLIAAMGVGGCSAGLNEKEAINTGSGNGNGAGVNEDGENRGYGNGNSDTKSGQGEQGSGVGSVGQNNNPRTVEMEELTLEEIDGILLMREEEKLAHDVYQALYDRWGMNIFINIASSESAHMDAVGELIVLFGLDDPLSGQEGEFTNGELQDLYDTLVSQGEESLEEALRVGAAIEEIDILDLQELMEQSTNPEILRVYGNLLSGSENHLRSFVRTLEQQTGDVYEPAYLTPENYDAILASSFQGGPGNGSGGGNRGAGRGRG